MSEESQYSEHPGGWIEWFCALEDHQFLCELDEDFVKDTFNHYGLKQRFNFFNESIEMILSQEMPEDHDLEDERFLEIYQQATDIYGLLHSRYITTSKGLAIMREHLLQGRFGHCPRVYCGKQNVIPIGLCEDLKTARVKVFCPRCEEAYIPKKKCADVDGAYFGKTFPQLLLMSHPDIVPKYQLLPDTVIMSFFEPTVYGFKVYGKKGSRFEGKQSPNEEKKVLNSDKQHLLENNAKINNSVTTNVLMESYSPIQIVSEQTQQIQPSQGKKNKKKNKAKQ